MAAVTFHSYCTPTIDAQCATFQSKYDGTCEACKGTFSKGDEILYHNPQRKPQGQQSQSSPRGNAAAPGQLADLEQRVKVLEQRLTKLSVDSGDRFTRIETFAAQTRTLLTADQPDAF